MANIPSVNYNILDLINQTPDTIWKQRYHWHHVDFNDGQKPVRINGHDININYLMWQMYKPFGLHPTKDNIFRRELFTGKRFIKMVDKSIGEIDESLSKAFGTNHGKTWDIYDRAYQALTDTYNFYVARIPEFAGTLSGFDLLSLSESPALNKALADIPEDPQPADVGRAYEAATHAIVNDKEMVDNNILRWLRCEIYDHKIFDQMLVMRGFCPDINGNVFPFCVKGKYVEGIKLLHEQFAESRLGGMAVLFQKSPLQTTEFGNRRNQSNCSVIEKVDHGHDCGNKPNIPLLITKQVLSKYAGKDVCFAASPDDIFSLDESMTDLIGKEVLYRSIGGCTHHDPQHICGGCFGLLHKQQPPGCNLGHQIASIIFEVISQLVLSIKHSMASTNFSVYEPVGTASEFLQTQEMKIKLKRGELHKTNYIKIPYDQAVNISMINSVSDIKVNFNPNQIGSFTKIKVGFDMHSDNVDTASEYELPVSSRDSVSHLSPEFVKYMKTRGWETTNNGKSYRINLDEWDYNLPVFTIPMRHQSMLDYFRFLSKVLESDSDGSSRSRKLHAVKTVSSCTSFVEAVTTLDDALSEGGLGYVHISNIETIIRANSIRGDGDYRPANNGNAQFLPLSQLMRNRSHAQLMGFQNATLVLDQPSTYLNYKRPRSWFDDLIG